MIEFSLPLMFEDDFADKIIKLNNSLTKSKITSVYGSFPMNLLNKCGYEEVKINKYIGVETEEDFFKYVKKVQDAGLEFVYLLNSTRSWNPEEFYDRSSQINAFIKNLLKHKIYILNITNIQLIDYVSVNFPQIEIRASTGQEFTSMRQYKNMFAAFHNIADITPSWDMNRNFDFFKNFKKTFNNKIELVVNDGCLAGCPFRVHHSSSLLSTFDADSYRIPNRFNNCYNTLCGNIYDKNPWEYFVLLNIIYPWQINTYAEKYGITKFRFMDKDFPLDAAIKSDYFDFYEAYLKGIENFEEIKDVPFKLFAHYTSTIYMGNIENVSIGEIKEFIPEIEYFEKNGYNCLNVCGDSCRYCYNLAENLNKKFPFINY